MLGEVGTKFNKLKGNGNQMEKQIGAFLQNLEKTNYHILINFLRRFVEKGF